MVKDHSETRCRHIGYSYRLTARVLLYAPSHRQDNTYHGRCYTSRGALAGTRNKVNGSTPWRIDPTTHRTMSERPTSELRPAPFPSLKCAQIFLGLNPTGHSIFHKPSVCYRPRSDCLYSLVPASAGDSPLLTPPPPTLFSCSGQRTVPVTGVRYNNLLWMCTLNTLTWPDLTCKSERVVHVVAAVGSSLAVWVVLY